MVIGGSHVSDESMSLSAAGVSSGSVVSILLLNGADPEALDGDSCNAMDVAAVAGHNGVVEFLAAKMDA